MARYTHLMSAPRLGEHYHCYCSCGSCENFEHCYRGECDAPKTFQDLAGVNFVAAGETFGGVPAQPFDWTPYQPRAFVDMAVRQPSITPDPKHYMAVDSHGSPKPCDNGCDAWSYADLCPVHGNQEMIWNAKIENMIDWMEDHDIALEPWQASAFRAIMRAQGNRS